VGRCILDPSSSGDGQVAGCYEHGHEPSGYRNAGNFLTE
jgi:hypothetical protein